MGTRYVLEITCPKCGFRSDYVYYAPTCGFNTWKCECGYIIDLEKHIGISREETSNIDEIREMLDLDRLEESYDELQEVKKYIAKLEDRVEKLQEQVGIAYWHGHTEGRVYGSDGISKEEIERGSRWVENALKSGDDDG